MEKNTANSDQDFEKFKKGVSQAQETRKESYGMALTIIEQRHVSQLRARALLAQKYGEKSDRVAEMDRKLAANATLGKATKTQQGRAMHATSNPEGGQWKMVGRVVNDEGRALPGLTVSLFSLKGAWERPLGHTCTDASGYYSFEVKDPKLVIKYLATNLVPTVTDKGKEILHQELQPVQLMYDSMEVRDMIIKSSRCSAPEDNYVYETPPSDPGDTTPEEGKVTGLISTNRGAPAVGVIVRAATRGTKGNIALGKEVLANEKGEYVIRFKPADLGLKAFEKTVNITVHVYDVDGNELAASSPADYSPYDARIDLKVKDRNEKQ